MIALSIVVELANLLAEKKQVQEKIHKTQAELSIIKRKISESLVRRYISGTEEKIELPEDFMKEEQSYERLLEALLEIRNEIAKQVRPVEERIVQANIEHLRRTFQKKKDELTECLNGIKQKIIDCRAHLEEYERLRLDLNPINENLSRLGADPLPIPEPSPSMNVGEVIKRFVDELKAEGKL